jgi:hypothetical protein
MLARQPSLTRANKMLRPVTSGTQRFRAGARGEAFALAEHVRGVWHPPLNQKNLCAIDGKCLAPTKTLRLCVQFLMFME